MSTARAAVAAAPSRVRPQARPALRPAPDAPRQRRHLRVVPDAAPTPSSAGRALTTLVVLLFVALFGLVVFQSLLVQAQNQLDSLNTSIAANQAEAKQLELAIAGAENPDRITSAAEERLGMVFPAEVAFLAPSRDDDAAVRWDGATAPATAGAVDDGATATAAQDGTTSTAPTAPAGTVDPTTGLPAVAIDPVTGQPTTVYDPATGLPITGYDPTTGAPIVYDPAASTATTPTTSTAPVTSTTAAVGAVR